MEKYMKYRVGHIFIKEGSLIIVTPEELSNILKCENPDEIYQPIIITDKILNTMGFGFNGRFGSQNSYYKFFYKTSNLTLHFVKFWNAYRCSSNNSKPILKYFHELQDLLYFNNGIIITYINLVDFHHILNQD